HCQLPAGLEHQTVAELVIDAEHHEQAGALVGNFHAFASDAVAYGFAGLVHRQYVADFQTIACALVQGDHVELADLVHATRHVDNHILNINRWLTGHESGVDFTLFGGEQTIPKPHFLSGAAQHQCADIAFFRDELAGTDVVGVDTEEFLGFRIHVGLALTEDTVDSVFIVELTACIDTITSAADDALGVARNDVRLAVELFRSVNDAVA